MINRYRKKMIERIERGVAWLNSRDEQFWADYTADTGYDRNDMLDGNWLELDLDNLDLGNASYCVLGQVGGDYTEMIHFANLSDEEASSLGFVLDEDEYDIEDRFENAHYSKLTELWIVKIRQLRAEKKAMNGSSGAA